VAPNPVTFYRFFHPFPVPEHQPAVLHALVTDEQRERELIARILAGEHECFYDLIQPYERRVFAAAFALVQNAADAEETAQESILKAFQHLEGFRGDSRFSTWLLRIAINEAKMFLRRSRGVVLQSLTPEEETDYVPLQLASWREVPSALLEQKELRQELAKALAALPEKYREVLVLRDMEGLSIQETAKTLEISETNVKIRLLRARLKMRDRLALKLESYGRRGGKR